VVERCAGLVAPDVEFDLHFERALVLHQQRPMPFERARTELCWGERQRRAGERRRSREPLSHALETFEDLRAAPWAERARSELKATGVTLQRRSDPAGSNRLTVQELRVARVIAVGATVREAAAELFLSPKTIEAHLTRAYRKLGVRNRAELVRALARDDDSRRRAAAPSLTRVRGSAASG